MLHVIVLPRHAMTYTRRWAFNSRSPARGSGRRACAAQPGDNGIGHSSAKRVRRTIVFHKEAPI